MAIVWTMTTTGGGAAYEEIPATEIHYILTVQQSGLTVRYLVVAAFFLAILVFLLFAYFHAQRRIRRGQPPLAYHRWLVSRRQHRYTQNSYYQNHGHGQQAYGMQNHPPAPPAYSTWDAPPQYQPPTGGSKTLANQNIQSVERTEGESSHAGLEYPPPSRPPPGHISQPV